MITSIDQLDLSKRYSYADYLKWQLEEYVELIRGKVFRMSPSPGRRHQDVSSMLLHFLLPKMVGGPCRVYHAPFDVRLLSKDNDAQTYTVVQPDICIVCDPAKLDKKGCLGAPDLVVEILSPSTSQKDLGEKFYLYEEAGVKEYWVVDPIHNLLDQYVLVEGNFSQQKAHIAKDEIQSAIFPEIKGSLENIFLD